MIRADDTPLLVNKDGRPAGSKSYMWVYRTRKYQMDRQVILYDYQKTRKADHPREFLKEFRGVCVTDGYQVYHTLEDLRYQAAGHTAAGGMMKQLKHFQKANRK